MAQQEFLPFAPRHSVSVEEWALLVQCAHEEVENVLALKAAQFWSVLRDNASLERLVVTFLRHAPRPYEADYAAAPSTFHTLSRRMLDVFARVLQAPLQDPGAPTLWERPHIAPQLFSAESLLSACSVWGNESASGEPLTACLRSACRARPQAASSLPAMAEESCREIEAAAQALGASGDKPGLALASVLDALCTLCCGCRLWPQCASALAGSAERLVPALAALHAALQSRVSSQGARGEAALSPTALSLALTACQGLTAALLERGLLAVESPGFQGAGPEIGSRSESKNGIDDGRTGGSSASKAGTSLIPALPDSSHALPTQRGERLMRLLLALHDASPPSVPPAPPSLSESLVLPPLAPGRALGRAVAQGAVALDPVQLEYAGLLLGVRGLERASAAWEAAGGAQAAPGAPPPPSSAFLTQESAAAVDRVCVMMPDAGPGFVAACLEALGQNESRVVEVILDGVVPPAVQAMGLAPDASMLEFERCAGAGRAGDKGKKARGEGEGGGVLGLAGRELVPWDAPLEEAESEAAGGASFGGGRGRSSLTGSPPRAQPPPPSEPARAADRYLSLRDAGYRAVLHRTARAAQWEEEGAGALYEDEYDDTLDGLDHLGAPDGAAAEEKGVRLPGAADGLAWRGGGEARAKAGPGARSVPTQAVEPVVARKPGGPLPPPKRDSHVWILDGKVYNGARPGARQVLASEAQAILAYESTLIHGLGRGGNVPAAAESSHPQGGAEAGARRADGRPSGSRSREAAGKPQGGRGGRDRAGEKGGEESRDRTLRQHKLKDQHKAAVGNHHRKDRAARKMAQAGMG